MNISKSFYKGNVVISSYAIASIAGNAALECYGVVGLTSKSRLKDSMDDFLESEDYIKGVTVKQTKKGIEITIFIIVAFGLKITEIVSEVQKKVQYVLRKGYGFTISSVNVYVKSVKEI